MFSAGLPSGENTQYVSSRPTFSEGRSIPARQRIRATKQGLWFSRGSDARSSHLNFAKLAFPGS